VDQGSGEFPVFAVEEVYLVTRFQAQYPTQVMGSLTIQGYGGTLRQLLLLE
jgi:hypothetical protein